MMLRAKSLRRLGILLAVVAAMGAVGAILWYRQHEGRRRQLESDRKSGLAAYMARDYSKAIDPLERYLRERDEDTIAALAFADARFHVETSNNLHIKQAVDKLDSILKREPDNISAKHLLLDIYPQTTNTDALERLSDEVLAKDPGDLKALHARITVRVRQSRLEEALTTAKLYAQQKPEDLQSRMLAMQLMQMLKKTGVEITEFAQTQFAANKMDARHLLLQAFAANYTNDNDKALWYLQQSAAQPLDDADFIRLLANLFDQMKRFDDSRSLLEQAATRTGNPDILRILIVRLWQNGRDDDIVSRLAALDPANPKSDAELLALRAMAHFQLQQPEKARPILEELRQRKDSRKAAAWVTALEARFEDYAQPPATVATKMASALSRDPDNGIFRSWLADSYWNLGEAALAMRQWSAASVSMPSWSKPYLGMSLALGQLGHTTDARDAAKAAFERVPTTASAINLALARYRVIEETSDTRGAEEVLGFVQQIQKAIPGEPRTLPLMAALYARTGKREQALTVLDGVIAKPGSVDAETLVRLAGISRADALGREMALLDAIGDKPVTPRLAQTRATLLAESGKSDEGLKYLQALAARATGTDKDDWAIAVAQFLDATDNPAAADTWRKLGDEHPESLDMQRAILTSARSVRQDRAMVEKTINRLKLLTGPEGQQWKLQRARWLIESPDTMRDGVEAVTILRELVVQSPRQIELRLQLAKALERTGNTMSAIEHLRAAQGIDPRSASVTLELVRLLQDQGQNAQVRDVLRQLSSTAMINARQRVMLASLFADVGDSQRAVELLAGDESRGVLLPAGRLLLAELQRRSGDSAKAGALFDSLLADKAASPGAIAAAAEFYASEGDVAKARTLLTRLDISGAQPAEIAVTLARFEERFGAPEAALKQFRAAAATGTESGSVALIDYLLRTRDFSQAVTVARDAQQKITSNALIANRLLEAQALVQLQNDPKNIQPLIDALSRDASRAAEVEALKVLADIRAGKVAKADITARLRTAADKYPRFLPLQEQIIENYLDQKKLEEAVTVARRTVEALPTDPAATQLAVRTFRSAKRWNDMRNAAEQWKQRSRAGNLEADTAIAEALLESRKPDEALKHLSSHRAEIENDVRTQPQAAVVMARAMLAQGNGKSARDLLRPLLKDVSGRRMWLMITLGATTDLPEATRWLEDVIAATPQESVEERYALASAWTTVGRKYNDTKTLNQAATQIAAYLTSRPRDGEALLLLGGVYQQLGRTDAAETALRAILESKPDHPAAANDLACALVAQNRSLDEAEKLARLAVEKSNGTAAYHDTLARVLMARKQLDAAKVSFETSLRLDPELVAARVGLARLLSEKGDTQSAIRELKRIDTQLQVNPRAGEYLQTELTALRAQLSQTDP